MCLLSHDEFRAIESNCVADAINLCYPFELHNKAVHLVHLEFGRLQHLKD